MLLLLRHTLPTGGTVPHRYTPRLQLTYQSSVQTQTSQSSVGHSSVPYTAMLREISFFFKFLFPHRNLKPVPVAARSKALVCGRSPAEIVGSGSDATEGMGDCLL